MTILGYICLPVGIICFLFSEKWLFRLFVFWTLFSATSAINFGDQDTASALQLWMLFGALWLLRRTIRLISDFSFSVDRRILTPCLWLGGFVLVASVSLVMPAYINGRLVIVSAILGQQGETPLYLTWHNVTQLLYLIFGISLAIGIGHRTLSGTAREEIERTLLISAIVISLWGAFQFVCNLTGIAYPYYIFNNSASPSAAGFQQTLSSGITRISSATLEPSVFAQCLVATLPFTLPAWLGMRPVLSRAWDRFASLLFVVLLILSTSSTAILGIATFAILLLAALKKTKLASLGRVTKLSLVFAGIVVAVIILLASSAVAREAATAMLFNKAEGGSAIERAMTVVLAFGYFQRYPILGIGWGSATSHDFFVLLLSNVGIVGALTFTGGMLVVIARAWRNLPPERGQINSRCVIWFLSLAVFLSMSIIVGFPLVFGNFWVILGMAIGAGQQSIPTNRLPESAVVAA